MNAKTATVVLLACASTLLAKGGDPLDDSLIFDLALLGDEQYVVKRKTFFYDFA